MSPMRPDISAGPMLRNANGETKPEFNPQRLVRRLIRVLSPPGRRTGKQPRQAAMRRR